MIRDDSYLNDLCKRSSLFQMAYTNRLELFELASPFNSVHLNDQTKFWVPVTFVKKKTTKTKINDFLLLWLLLFVYRKWCKFVSFHRIECGNFVQLINLRKAHNRLMRLWWTQTTHRILLLNCNKKNCTFFSGFICFSLKILCKTEKRKSMVEIDFVDLTTM